MASSKVTGSGNGLITVHEYAERHGVEDSIVRSWIKRGYVRASLVGPRMMKLEAGDGAHPVIPTRAGRGLKVNPEEGITIATKREKLVGLFIAFQGMDRDTARSVAEGMDVPDVEREYAEYEGKDQPF